MDIASQIDNLLANWPLLYLVCGLLFGVLFVFLLANLVDIHARGGSLGFRLMILPTSVIIWPLVLVFFSGRICAKIIKAKIILPRQLARSGPPTTKKTKKEKTPPAGKKMAVHKTQSAAKKVGSSQKKVTEEAEPVKNRHPTSAAAKPDK